VALIISQNVNRRHQTKGSVAIAVALQFPEPAKLKRAGSPETGQPLTMVDRQRLSEARLVVRYAPALGGWCRFFDSFCRFFDSDLGDLVATPAGSSFSTPDRAPPRLTCQRAPFRMICSLFSA
jgi:hypothetical protein